MESSALRQEADTDYQEKYFELMAKDLARYILNKNFISGKNGSKPSYTAKQIARIAKKSGTAFIEHDLEHASKWSDAPYNVVPEYKRAAKQTLENYDIFVAEVTMKIVSECKETTDNDGIKHFSRRE